MNKKIKIIIKKVKLIEIFSIFIINFSLLTISLAATYYVDFVNGSDTNNGLSIFTPFKHCPGDDRATNIAASIKLVPGDKVIFKGGVAYEAGTNNYVIKINSSGNGDSDENRIIYDGDSGTYAPRWGIGNEKAIIKGEGKENSPRFFFYFNGSQSYITINGFIMKGAREVPEPGGGVLIYNSYLSNYVNISNNDLSDAGINNNDYASGACIYNFGGDYWKIYNNNIVDCGSTGIALNKVNYNKMFNNVITGHNTWGFSLMISGDTNITGNEIYNNIIYDINRYYNPSEKHGNWDYIFSGQGSTPTYGSINNTKIYNNIFYNSFSNPIPKSTAMIHQSVSNNGNWDGLYIFNNVMFNTDSQGINIGTYPAPQYNGSLKNVYIIGNTFYSPSSNRGISIINGNGDPTKFKNLYVINNTIYTGNAVTMSLPAKDNVSGDYIVDYNNHYSTRPYPERMTTKDGKTGVLTWHTWEQWQALGFDLHGKGSQSNPLYINTNVGHNFDLRLQSGSPCIDSGFSMGPPFDIDKNGISRPQGAKWDIGAYESSKEFLSSPNPPRGLRIVKPE